MALQTSGAISLNDIHMELGATSGTTVSLNDTDVRGLVGISSGAIDLADFYGASSGWVQTLVSGTQSYRGILSTVKPNTGWTSQSYLYSGSITDDTFDPIASQNIASTSTVSTAGIIRDMFTNNNQTQTFFRIWAVTTPSDSGWTTIRCQGTGSDTTDNTLNRTDGNAFYNSFAGYRQYRWGTSSSPVVFIPAFSTTYTITAT